MVLRTSNGLKVLNLGNFYLGLIVPQASFKEPEALSFNFHMFCLFNLTSHNGTCLASVEETFILIFPTAVFPCSPFPPFLPQ